MAAPTGTSRDIAIATPLGDKKLLLEAMTGEEHLSRPFEFTISMLSPAAEKYIDGKELLGENVTVRLSTHDENTPRYFNGFVTSFTQLPQTSDNFLRYQIVIHPWLWFLTQTSDYRIFQEKTVPDIIKQVFRDHGFSDFDEKLEGKYRTWEYCVQYRETDFNFVSRLMEQEGIYYYFKHEDGKHMLVLADGRGAVPTSDDAGAVGTIGPEGTRDRYVARGPQLNGRVPRIAAEVEHGPRRDGDGGGVEDPVGRYGECRIRGHVDWPEADRPQLDA